MTTRIVNSELTQRVRNSLCRSAEFVRKSKSFKMKFYNFLLNMISSFVWLITFGKVQMFGHDEFMDIFRTTIRNKVYLIDSDFDGLESPWSTGVHIHELVHVDQYVCNKFHSLKYLFSPSYRYRAEMEGFKVQMAVIELYGHDSTDLKNWVVDLINGPKYFWCHFDKAETMGEFNIFVDSVRAFYNHRIGFGHISNSTRVNTFVNACKTQHQLIQVAKRISI